MSTIYEGIRRTVDYQIADVLSGSFAFSIQANPTGITYISLIGFYKSQTDTANIQARVQVNVFGGWRDIGGNLIINEGGTYPNLSFNALNGTEAAFIQPWAKEDTTSRLVGSTTKQMPAIILYPEMRIQFAGSGTTNGSKRFVWYRVNEV